MGGTIFTVGHSTHTLGVFLDLLAAHAIDAVADVRSAPWSPRQPHFHREALAPALRAHGVTYVFLGAHLGARPDDPACYRDGRVHYPLLARTEVFQAGLDRVCAGSAQHRIALMCAEADPIGCHRSLLIARHLAGRQRHVQHILRDGSLRSHADVEAHLLDASGESEADLFASRAERLDRAYAWRAARR